MLQVLVYIINVHSADSYILWDTHQGQHPLVFLIDCVPYTVCRFVHTKTSEIAAPQQTINLVHFRFNKNEQSLDCVTTNA